MGDDTRSWRPPSAPLPSSEDVPKPDDPPESAYFLSVNRNKRSICVDFKKPDGLDIVHKLVQQSDVLVENFIPGSF
jgi:succinate--hydroxymethylglutarate CoA-transferase